MAKWDGVQSAVQRWRFNPFTETSQYITLAAWETENIVGDTHTVAVDDQGNYVISAREGIYDDGAILLQYDSGGWQDGIEVDFAPTAVGQFQVDYKYKSGKIRFNVGMNGMDIRLKYTAMGTAFTADPLVRKITDQDSMYGHLWMHFDTQSWSITNVSPLTWFWFLVYHETLPVNEPSGKYAHWPRIKYQKNGGGLVDLWSRVNPGGARGPYLAWGGSSMTPPLGFDYVGGILWMNNWGFGLDTDAEMDMHGETDPKQIQIYLDGKEVVGISIAHTKKPTMGMSDKNLDGPICIPLTEAIPIIKGSNGIKTFQTMTDEEIYKVIRAEHLKNEIELVRSLINA